MKKIFSILTTFFLVGSISISAQTVSVETYGVAPRDAAADTLDIFDLAYNGLVNVGKETKVFLVGKSDTTLSASSWSVVSGPDGANTSFGDTQDLDTASQAVSFVPNLVGSYVIEFADGGGTAQITINAGTYLSMTGGSTACVACHSSKAAEWGGTGHATALIRGLNGEKGSFFSGGCVSCHSTGNDPNADNDGFDDWPFVFPDTVMEGMADSMIATYPDAMARANIQCESCHGPGSEHFGNKAGIAQSFNSKTCAYCHNSGTHHVYPEQYEFSKHATGTRQYAQDNPSRDRSSCMPCHNGAGFVAAIEDKPQTETEKIKITCATCHDPHSNADGNHQLRTTADVVLPNGEVISEGGYGKLCMNCHNGRRDAAERLASTSRPEPHHAPQAEIISGKNVPTFGYSLPSSPHLQIENSCVTCHMSEGHVDAEKNVILVGSHSLNMRFPDGTDNVEACAECHGEIGESFAEKKYYFNGIADHDGDGVEEGVQEEVEGMMEELALLLHPVDSLEVNSRDGEHTYSMTEKTAIYNYFLVEEDRSMGIHNPAFTVALLKVSMESMKYGLITAGAIQSIADIPMDQGNQVRLVWTKFGADDGVAMDALKSYTILRKAADAVPGKTIAEYPSITQIPADINVGNTLALAGEIWDVVKEVEAIQYIEYSAVVPTLYNTVEGDTAWTTFKVLGKTASGVVAETAPMDGFSTDDLAPMAPTNLLAQVAGNGVMLVWDEAVDKDFNFFEVYRSEEQGFIPSQDKLLSTTTTRNHVDLNLVEGKTYYYVVTAKDFSFNMSGASNEVNANLTDIAAESGIPTEFALNQNYPNPFNPSTAIKFAIPEATNVSLVIYDMLGNQVEVLVDNQMNAGYYTFTWNASNYASGIYFCQMTAKDFIRVNKMLLIK